MDDSLISHEPFNSTSVDLVRVVGQLRRWRPELLGLGYCRNISQELCCDDFKPMNMSKEASQTLINEL